MRNWIGYPDDVLNNTRLNEIYENVSNVSRLNDLLIILVWLVTGFDKACYSILIAIAWMESAWMELG